MILIKEDDLLPKVMRLTEELLLPLPPPYGARGKLAKYVWDILLPVGEEDPYGDDDDNGHEGNGGRGRRRGRRREKFPNLGRW